MAPQVNDDRQRITVEEIERYRRKLLDTSKRNNLISFKHQGRSARQLRAVDESFDVLYKKLEGGSKLTFVPLPAPDVEPADEKTAEFRKAYREAKKTNVDYLAKLDALGKNPTDRAVFLLDAELRDQIRTSLEMPPVERKEKPTPSEVAAQLGLDVSFEMSSDNSGETRAKRRGDNKIQTLLFPETLESTVRSMYEHARLTASETGINTLHCAFGFLEWFESDDSKDPIISPLLLYPVEFEKEEKKGQYQFPIQSRDEDMVVNLSLRARLEDNFGILLPKFEVAENEDESSDTPEDYFKKLAPIIKNKKGWKIRRYFTLSFFSFAKLAMYEDLDPKNWRQVPFDQNKSLVTLLGGMEEDEINEGKPPDEREEKPTIPLHITDADSSQLAALQKVMEGKSLVIEGPPGTGKSQTITNIIAASLAAGKSILFVAEKLAALTVVKKRLDDFGLGEFCLELHSSKTRKAEVLKSFETRLRRYRTETVSVHHILQEVEEQADRLNRYVTILNEPFAAINRSLHAILGCCIRLRSDFPSIASIIDNIALEGVMEMTDMDMERRKSLLHASNKSQKRVLGRSSKVENHPWYGLVCGHFGVTDQDRVIGRTERLLNDLRNLISNIAPFMETLSLKTTPSLDDIVGWTQKIQSIQIPNNPPSDQQWKWMWDESVRRAGQEFVDLLKEALSLRAREQELSGTCHAIDEAFVSSLVSLEKAISAGHHQQQTLDEIKTRSKADSETSAEWASVERLLKKIGEFLRLDLSLDMSAAQSVLSAVEVVRQLPRQLLPYKISGLMDPQNIVLIKEFSARTTSLEEIRVRLDKIFFVHSDLAPSDVRAHAGSLQNISFFSFLDPAVRQAKKAVRSFIRPEAGLQRKDMSKALYELAEYLEQRKRMNGDTRIQGILGVKFEGVATDFGPFIKIGEWADTVRSSFSTTEVLARQLRDRLLEGTSEFLEGLASFAGNPDFEKALRLLSSISQSLEEKITTQITSFRTKSENADRLVFAIEKLGIPMDQKAVQAIHLIPVARRLFEIQHKLQDNRLVKTAMADTYHGVDTDLTVIEATLHLAASIQAAKLPNEIEKSFFKEDGLKLLERSRSLLAGLSPYIQQITTLLGEIESFAGTTEPKPQTSLLRAIPVDQLERKLSAALEIREEIGHLCDFLRDESDCREMQLGPLLDRYRAIDRSYDDLPQAFEFAFWQSLARRCIESHSELEQFTGLRHETLAEEFRRLDKKSLDLQRKKLINDLLAREPERGNSVGRAKDFTEMALIKREISKTKRHIPIRQLLDRAGSSSLTLKPCFMMSPLSVASFLKPNDTHFDIVIMDEASQLRPEDALGAVARARQVVVVGDSKQLPPTSFFETADNEKDTDDESDAAGNESVLDVPKNWPRSRLIWHYRSRHDKLIAFSNRHFYQDELIVFPSPLHVHKEFGVHFEQVEGCYQGRRNMLEARSIVDEAVNMMKRQVKRSIGIVALNQEQRDLIMELFEQKTNEEPAVREYRSYWDKTLEPFFIKNLENVQGDERDVILISTVYGKDSEGAFHQRFGPINGAMGHRRLNVLFTRAKFQLKVFSSIDPDKIQVGETSSLGLKAFKGYLDFAKNGKLTQPEFNPGRPADSEFELAVKHSIEQLGYSVEGQLGVAGYFMDLAIRHPEKPGTFLLGVECDGATYHSSRSARDRDRIRQEILEQLTWKLHRIWSVDWFRNPRRELDRLKSKIEELLAEDKSRSDSSRRSKTPEELQNGSH